jgi:hypothetical protein
MAQDSAGDSMIAEKRRLLGGTMNRGVQHGEHSG